MLSKSDFWRDATSFDLTGNEMERLLTTSLQDNAYSLTGCHLRKARETERVLARRGDASVGNSATSALAFAEDDVVRCGADARAEVAGLVTSMGLTYTPEAPSAPANRSTGQPIHKRESSSNALAVDDVTKPTITAAEERKPVEGVDAKTEAAPLHPLPSQQTRATPTTAAPSLSSSSSGPPKSALAKLVAQAKAKHQGPADAVSAGSRGAPASQTAEASLKRLREPEVAAQKTNKLESMTGKAKDKASGGGKEENDEDDDEDDFAVALPPGVTLPTPTQHDQQQLQEQSPEDIAASAALKHPSQMTREEFLSQFKRAPRRGEVGQSAEEIARAQQLGYVMSGSRSIGAQMYVDRVQRQLHEREAGKLQQQFRKVEDERMDSQMIQGMLRVLEEKTYKKGDANSSGGGGH